MNFLIYIKRIRNMNSLIHTKEIKNLGHYSWRECEGPAISKYKNNYIKSKNTAEMRESHKYMYLHI
jgi:hypothetical protein